MFPDYIINNKTKDIVRDFVIGSMLIDDFMELLYKENGEIFDYLQGIIDYMAVNDIEPKRQIEFRKYGSQNTPVAMRSSVEDLILKYRRTNKAIFDADPNFCPTLREHLKNELHKTAAGAFVIHYTVSDIYFQIDDETKRTEIYHDAYVFSLDVLPSYLGGVDAENYISEHIISKIPEGLGRGAKKKIVKEEIEKQFKRQTQAYPRWIQSPEWPIGSNNKPMIYVKQVNHKAKTEHDDYYEYYFIDENSGEERIIRQGW